MLKHLLKPLASKLLIALIVIIPVNALANNLFQENKNLKHLQKKEVLRFISTLKKKHGFSPEQLNTIFATYQYDPTLLPIRKKRVVAIQKKGSPWLRYKRKAITNERLEAGRRFYVDNYEIFLSVEKKFRVDSSYILAILGLETNYGTFQGSRRVFDTLTTLAFHKRSRRKKLFSSELREFLMLYRNKKLQLSDIGSRAGAMGMSQFLPTSLQNFGIDFDNDGHVNLFNSKADAIASIANYLKHHGWQHNKKAAIRLNPHKTLSFMARSKYNYSVRNLQKNYGQKLPNYSPKTLGKVYKFSTDEKSIYWYGMKNFRILKQYNHSNFYAMSIMQLADLFKLDKVIGAK